MSNVRSLIERVLLNVAITNEPIIHKGDAAYFDCVEAPDISLRDFMDLFKRLHEHEWIHAFILIIRLLDAGDINLTVLNVHRLIVSALIVAVKYNREVHKVLCYFSKKTGLEDLAEMESVFLRLIDWRLVVTKDHYENVVKMLPSLPASVDNQRSLMQSVISLGRGRSGNLCRLAQMIVNSRSLSSSSECATACTSCRASDLTNDCTSEFIYDFASACTSD